ncbi:outer membrane beta-barrel protein [Flavobacterium dauae]|uniref:outer membrane beta-barrel protein n=1 Tax=Flavobacterium dauae TaxID=1563479 RepID=UPI00101B285B|nr:outer membrane beta-barrel protein [Flavobacterium dauae]WLD24519.1 outer membrane beta-barrel protein [Flavobacterium dauae]
MKHIIFLLGIFSFQLISAQSQQANLSATIGITTIPNFDNQGIGFDLSARYYFTDAFSLGGHFYTASPKFNHGFGYDTDRTLINMYAIDVPLQYDVINTEKFTLGLGFSNGVLLNVLRNRNETTEEEFWDTETGVGTSWNVPKKIKTDAYYLVTPYADASYKLLTLDKEDFTSMYITAKAGYQNAFGNGFYSKASDFRNYIVSLGITIKGTTD